jgi:site-specific recombinase XerD
LKGLKVSGRFPSGNPRHYFRTPAGEKDIPLPDAPKDSPEFLEAYLKAAKGEFRSSPHARHKNGTIGAAVRGFLASEQYQTRAASTRQVWRRMLEDIEKRYGKPPISHLTAKHIRLDLAELSPHPANNRLKVWRALCKWALEVGLTETDPAREVRPRKAPESDGYAPWTQEDVDKFRKRWGIGTMQRFAFELMVHTGAAIGDAVKIGPGNIKEGWLSYKRAKSKTLCTCPITAPWPDFFPGSPYLQECIEKAPKALTFLCTPSGRPRSPKSATQWFSSAAGEVLAPGKTAHGVRKYLAVTMTERGATPEQRMAILGHDTTKQTQEYSKTADARQIISGTKFDNFSEQVVKTGK